MLPSKQLRGRSGLHEELPIHPQAARFDRTPSSSAAVQHSVPHKAISQVIRPDMATFLEDDRVVVRTHHDELCCVERFIAKGPLCAADVEYLEQFPHLVQLDFPGRVTDDTCLAFVATLTRLEHLTCSLCGDGRVGAAGLTSIGKLHRLRHLNLCGCRGVDAAGLAAVGKLSQLQHLDISWCDDVDAAGLASVGNLCQLQHLDLCGCRGVDAAGLASVGRLSQLRHLNLSDCRGVDAAGLAEIGRLHQMQHLNLKNCGGVDDEQLAALRRMCPEVVR